MKEACENDLSQRKPKSILGILKRQRLKSRLRSPGSRESPSAGQGSKQYASSEVDCSGRWRETWKRTATRTLKSAGGNRTKLLRLRQRCNKRNEKINRPQGIRHLPSQTATLSPGCFGPPQGPSSPQKAQNPE